MRINLENKSLDLESRDINYILPAYVRSYMFYSKNELPEKIIFPMFPSVAVQGNEIPIEYVPPLDVIAVEISKDGADIAEVTPEQEATLDETDDRIKELKAEVAIMTNEKEVSSAKSAFAEAPQLAGKDPEVKEIENAERYPNPPSTYGTKDREPKQPPGGDIGTGMSLSNMGGRDPRDQGRVAKDLKDEPEIAEEKEKPFEKTITRDETGKPVVEDKNG